MKTQSDTELLATLIGEKDLVKVEKLLYYDGGQKRLGSLANITMEEIVNYTALTKNQANRLVASIELGKRISCEAIPKRDHICSPEDIAILFMEELRYEKQEHFCTLLLNTKNEIIGKEMVSKGNINSSIVDPRDVFCSAIKKGAASIALIHNHPSGNPEPSDMDIRVTDKLVEAGNLLDIKVVDHLIIGDGKFISFKRKRLIKEPVFGRQDNGIREKANKDKGAR